MKLAFTTFLLLATLSSARDPEWGGLGAVAVSPDGKTVCCGGDNRVLYVVDAATREVRQRIWIKSRVGGLAYSKDGSRLCLEDDEEVLHIFDTATWKETASVADSGDCAFAPASDLAVVVSSKEKGIRFISMTDGSKKGAAVVEGRLSGIGIDAAGGRVVVVSEGATDAAEAKAESSAMPKELKNVAKKEWQQKNDGQMATVRWFEAPSGKAAGEAKTFYSTRGRALVFMSGDAACVTTYDDTCARITPKGEATLFEVTGSYNYGRGASPDGAWAIGGGLRTGAIAPTAGGAPVAFELDRLPGWPEYFGGFTQAADGTWWGVTSASRLVKIGKDGKAEAFPVY